jgi:uncharacterized protein YkwD
MTCMCKKIVIDLSYCSKNRNKIIMIRSNSPKNTWLIYISVFTCLISILVFGYFLFQSSKVQNEALASSYSAEQVVLAVNQQRIKNQLSALTLNTKLSKSAQAKADDMSAKSYFSHKSPSDKKWSDFIKEVNYDYIIAGENLANGFDTVPKMVDAWMNSPSHRENILNKEVLETGIGISYGKLDNKPTIFVAQHFGKLDTTTTAKPVAVQSSKSTKASQVSSKAQVSSSIPSSASSSSIKPVVVETKPKEVPKPNSLSELLTLPPQKL